MGGWECNSHSIIVIIIGRTQIRIEIRIDGLCVCVIKSRSRIWRYSVEETGVDQFLQEELHVAQLGVLDAQRLQHAKVPVLHRHENRAQMFQVRSGKVKQGNGLIFSLFVINGET